MKTDVETAQTRPLTVLQAASCFTSWGGMELHLLNLSAQLRKRGHRMIVSAQPQGWVLPKAQALGLETLPATVRRQQDWSDFRTYYDFFRSNPVDVVHTHSNWDAVVPTLAARLAGVPVAVMSWHLPFPFKDRRGGRLLMTSLYDRMIAVSASVRNRHISHGVAPEKIEVIHHGTDIEAFECLTRERDQVRAEFGLSGSEVAFGILGRISKEKGHPDLLRAFQHLVSSGLPTRVVIVGEGEEELSLRQLAAELGVADRVVFTGFREDVNNVINALDVVVVPSIWEEPCSAVIQQGMALGKPVIGTRTGGTPEMVLNEETGLLVPPSDVPALAAAMNRLASAPSLCARMGTLGGQRVREHFSLTLMTDRVEALYRRELSRHAGRAPVRDCRKPLAQNQPASAIGIENE